MINDNLITRVINESGDGTLDPGEIVTNWVLVAEAEHPQSEESRIVVVNDGNISVSKAAGILEMGKYSFLMTVQEDDE